MVEKLLVLMDICESNDGARKELTNIINEMENEDMDYLYKRLISLKEKLQHVKGYITIANNHNKIKIAFDKDSVSEEIENEFFDICDAWSKKYKIEVVTNYEDKSLYIK